MIKKTIRFDQETIDCVNHVCNQESITFAEFVRKACNYTYFEMNKNRLDFAIIENMNDILKIFRIREGNYMD